MTLNEAIYTVLTTKYKKDAKEAFKMVEDAGYEMRKWDGWFIIENIKTKKHLYIDSHCYNPKLKFIRGSRIDKQINITESWKFDFVNYLNTPYNEEYYRFPKWKEINNNRREMLRHAKWVVEFRNEELDKVKAELEDAQRRLVRIAQRQAEAELELKQTRKELGLKRR